MRIDPKQLDSNHRVAQLRLAISRAISQPLEDGDQPHFSEIITALLESLSYWTRQQLKHDLGIKEEN